MCGLCWGRSILNPNIAKILEISDSDNHTVFINTGGIWELLLYASDEQFASILDLYKIPIHQKRIDILLKIIDDQLLYSMIQPLNHEILDWFDQPTISEFGKKIEYPSDPVRVYIVPTSEVPSNIFGNITPITELKNYGKTQLSLKV